jgi:hypothetical protein
VKPMCARKPAPIVLIVLFVAGALFPTSAASQSLWRLGFGLQTTFSTEDGLGLGLRTRASYPMNRDFSMGLDLGVHGYSSNGANRSVIMADPSINLILNLGATADRATYLVAGAGGYVLAGATGQRTSKATLGPQASIGLGAVKQLVDSRLFMEITPQFLLEPQQMTVIAPLRIGLIF